jgi:hypothetical protein
MEDHLEDEQDLCVLSGPPEPDRLTRLLEGRLAILFRVRCIPITNRMSVTAIKQQTEGQVRPR